MLAKFKQLFDNTQHAAVLALCLAILGIFVGLASMLASMVVAVVTIKRGAKAGATVMVWALLPILSSMVVSYFSLSDIYLLETIAVWGLAWLLFRGSSWLRVLECLLILAIVVIFAVHAIVPNLTDQWRQLFSAALGSSFVSSIADPGFVSSLKLATPNIAPFATGIVLSTLVFDIMLNLLVARALYIWLYRKQPANLDILQLRMPMIYSLVWLILLAVGLSTHQALVLDLLPLALPMFVIGGFSLLNAYVRLNPKRWVILIVFYVALLLFLPIAFMIVGFAGLLDSFVNFRRIWQRSKTFDSAVS